MTKLLAHISFCFRKHQWAVVGSLATIAFVLGIAGLYRLKAEAGGLDNLSWPDAVYFSLRLFGFNYDLGGEGSDPYATGNWQLWVARFLAPASTALAVAKAVAESVAQRCDRLRISRWTKHAVVCGVGERGYHLALSLRKERKQVVVIDEKHDLEHLKLLRAQGILVIRGNATDSETLAAARVDRAAVIVALTPSVEANLEVVLAASQRQNGLSGKALAYAPRSFATMFDGQHPFRRSVNGSARLVECGFFDHNATAARVLANKYVPDLAATLFNEQRGARILVAGDGEVLPELLGVLVAQCQVVGSHLPRITLVTSNKDSIGRAFPIYHPQMPLVVDLLTHSMPMPQMLSLSLDSLATDKTTKLFDLVFVACREDGDTLTLATNLAQQESSARSVIAGLTPSTQLDRRFDQYFGSPQPLEGVVVHNLLALGCEARDVVRQELDEQARAIHEKYFADRKSNGGKEGESLAMHSWENLRGDFRESNRSAADHIAIKTRILQLSQSDHTIEQIAEAEHRRWMAERIVSGWRHATSRNDQKRLHHNFVPYAALSEGDREKDRENVRKALATL